MSTIIRMTDVTLQKVITLLEAGATIEQHKYTKATYITLGEHAERIPAVMIPILLSKNKIMTSEIKLLFTKYSKVPEVFVKNY